MKNRYALIRVMLCLATAAVPQSTKVNDVPRSPVYTVTEPTEMVVVANGIETEVTPTMPFYVHSKATRRRINGGTATVYDCELLNPVEAPENSGNWYTHVYVCVTDKIEEVIPGDLNGDGKVNAFDLALMKRNWENRHQLSTLEYHRWNFDEKTLDGYGYDYDDPRDRTYVMDIQSLQDFLLVRAGRED